MPTAAEVRDLVGYQGDRGAFGEEACRAFLPGHRPVPLATFEAVVSAVLRSDTSRGMLPIENSTAGRVPGIAALIRTRGIRIEQRKELPVRLHLMALPGARLDEILTISSHPVALAQCAGTIAGFGLATRVATNTAFAARELSASGDRGHAVAASEAAAAAYGLTILCRDIHDRPDNRTLFGILARERDE